MVSAGYQSSDTLFPSSCWSFKIPLSSPLQLIDAVNLACHAHLHHRMLLRSLVAPSSQLLSSSSSNRSWCCIQLSRWYDESLLSHDRDTGFSNFCMKTWIIESPGQPRRALSVWTGWALSKTRFFSNKRSSRGRSRRESKESQAKADGCVKSKLF